MAKYIELADGFVVFCNDAVHVVSVDLDTVDGYGKFRVGDCDGKWIPEPVVYDKNVRVRVGGGYTWFELPNVDVVFLGFWAGKWFCHCKFEYVVRVRFVGEDDAYVSVFPYEWLVRLYMEREFDRVDEIFDKCEFCHVRRGDEREFVIKSRDMQNAVPGMFASLDVNVRASYDGNVLKLIVNDNEWIVKRA